MARKNIHELIGADATEFWEWLVEEEPSIAAIQLVDYPPPPLLQERIQLSGDDNDFLEAALELRNQHLLPFWDAIFATALSTGTVPTSILDAASFHQSIYSERQEVTREDVLNGELIHELHTQPEGTFKAVCSDVVMSTGDALHIPLIDFHCRPSPSNLQLVAKVCQRLLTGTAVVLDSGESYHAYSISLLSTEELITVLSMALLYSPIIDRAYIAHQLLERRCSLRISCGGRKNATPKVVAVI